MCEFGHCLVRPRDRDFDLTFTTNDRSIFGRLIVFPIKFRIRAVFWPHYSASPSFIHRLALVMRDGVAVQRNVSYLFLAGTGPTRSFFERNHHAKKS
jgi:hypothetical protein